MSEKKVLKKEFENLSFEEEFASVLNEELWPD
jgi:hypothetical protein